MREVFTMWRHTKMVVLVALTAAVYAAILIPLKGIPLIPGITELRPANVVPVVFSLLFGPAAAWGSAFGNLIGDFFGTLGLGSLFGFVGNFFYGLIPYKLWNVSSKKWKEGSLDFLTSKDLLRFPAATLLPMATWVLVYVMVFSVDPMPIVLLLSSTVAIAGAIMMAFHQIGSPVAKYGLPIMMYSAAFAYSFTAPFVRVPSGLTPFFPVTRQAALSLLIPLGVASLLYLLGKDCLRLLVHFMLPALLASVSCAAIISWGVDLFGLVPFGVLGPVISLNNFLAAVLLGPPLLSLIFPRARRWDILWSEIMESAEISRNPQPWMGALLMWIGGIGALVVGVLVSTGLYASLPFQFGTGSTGLGTVLAILPFLIVFVIGCLLA